MRRSLAAAAGQAGIGDDHLDPLELLQVGVARRGHRAAERAHQVHRAVRDGRRAVQDLLQRADRPDADPAARASGEPTMTASAPMASALAMSPLLVMDPSAITWT